MKTKEQNPDKTELHLMSLRKLSKSRWQERRGATKREKDLGGVPASKDVAGTSGSTWILLSVVPWGSGQAGWGVPPIPRCQRQQQIHPQFRTYHGQPEEKGSPNGETPHPPRG